MAVEPCMRNVWVIGFLPECVCCPGCEQRLSFCIYVNTWFVLCTCAIFRDSCVCVCVYSKYVLIWFMSSNFDNCVKWYWPTLGWKTLHCVVCRQMYCFTGRENQYSLLLTLGTELSSHHYMNSTTLQLHVWLEIKWHYYQLASVLFKS